MTDATRFSLPTFLKSGGGEGSYEKDCSDIWSQKRWETKLHWKYARINGIKVGGEEWPVWKEMQQRKRKMNQHMVEWIKRLLELRIPHLYTFCSWKPLNCCRADLFCIIKYSVYWHTTNTSKLLLVCHSKKVLSPVWLETYSRTGTSSVLKMNHYQKAKALTWSRSWKMKFCGYKLKFGKGIRLVTNHGIVFQKQNFHSLRSWGIMEDLKIHDINKYRHYPAGNDKLLKQSGLFNFGVWLFILINCVNVANGFVRSRSISTETETLSQEG